MTTTITDIVQEGSTAVVQVDFTDDAGTAATPNTAIWTLTDKDGNIINGRTSVSVSSLASTIYIVLGGDDLEIDSNGYLDRYLLVQGTYDSDRGTDLSFADQLKFSLEDLKGK